MSQQPFYKAITYNLQRDWPIWNQPYVDMKFIWDIDFEWCIITKNWVYLWIVYTTQGKMQSFLNTNKTKFKIVELTNQEAIDFFTSAIKEYIAPNTDTIITVAEQVANFSAKLW